MSTSYPNGGPTIPGNSSSLRTTSLRKLASILILSALVLAACGGSTQTAATVNSAVITVDDVEAMMWPSGESVIDKTIFANFLGAAIQLEVTFAGAEEEFGIVPSDEDVAAEADRMYEEFNLDQTRDEFLEAAGISESLLQDIARQQLISQSMTEEFATDDPSQEELDSVITSAEFCTSHILVETEEEANEVVQRLDDGEEFADVATEVSTDTGSGANGGELGCGPPSQYVAEFADAMLTAEEGVATEPVESQFGWHIVLVTERPTNEDLAELVALSAVTQWQNAAMASAEVVVEEEYGTWDPITGSVTPPAA